MSAFTKYITCANNGGLDLEAVLKALFVQHTDGSVGIRTVKRTITSCSSITARVSCTGGGMLTLEELIRESVVLDPCGKPALLLMDSTTAT